MLFSFFLEIFFSKLHKFICLLCLNVEVSSGRSPRRRGFRQCQQSHQRVNRPRGGHQEDEAQVSQLVVVRQPQLSSHSIQTASPQHRTTTLTGQEEQLTLLCVLVPQSKCIPDAAIKRPTASSIGPQHRLPDPTSIGLYPP